MKLRPCFIRVIPQSKTANVAKALPQFRLEDAPNVVLDTMKRAEDSPDIIIRLYEAYGGHARARLVWYAFIHSIQYEMRY